MSTPAAIARDVHKRYGGRTVIAGLTLEVPRGVAIAVAGSNGSGKSTLLRLLAGLVRPSSGEVRVDGFIAGSGSLLGRVTLLPEGDPFPLTVRIDQFLMYMARLQGVSASSRAVEERLEEFGDRSWLTARFGDLSFGMRRRVGLAQAFLGEPSLVLLDEPSEGLDGDAAERLRTRIAERRGNQTLVIASHDEAIKASCDSVITTAKGERIASL
jgi:ABC-2 type transport system ATP-binding protein